MNAIEHALSRVPHVEGMVGASLVETSTGHVLGTVGGAAEGEVSIVAAAATDLVHVVQLAAANLAAVEDLEELIVTLSGHHHLVRPMTGPGYEGLFLLVTLDREGANLALARHQLLAFESQIVT
jgi:hypothetical protein